MTQQKQQQAKATETNPVSDLGIFLFLAAVFLWIGWTVGGGNLT